MSKLFYILSTFIIIVLEVLIFRESSDLRIFTILTLYLFLISIKKITANMTIVLSMMLIFYSFILFIFTNFVEFINPGQISPFSERVAVFVYLFLVIAVFQKFKEL